MMVDKRWTLSREINRLYERCFLGTLPVGRMRMRLW